ncbi:DUF3087 domain-containing protein [Shewanella morhuae]|uniref:Protein of uncharacterized function (DUF3087) n=1 Tax=Shewanella morhuae TaxID=365591 RepID=A0A379ZGK4_9GAMM|nr:DUF3087 domain-containing protein [Shewanella morhuae]SUI61040.1 Protein of uncharacterised function (DUF3087) [Shewanella morhuae]
MKLQEIDKTRYRKNMNLLIVILVLSLVGLSLAFGSVLIAIFGATPIPGEPTGNFHLNLLGVILSVGLCGAVLHHVKERPFFREIYYVWRLKQLHNRIYRKLVKIKAAAAQNDVNALITLLFYYTTLRQVYLLDDNTLTLPALTQDLNRLNAQIDSLGLLLSAEQFTPEMLS